MVMLYQQGQKKVANVQSGFVKICKPDIPLQTEGLIMVMRHPDTDCPPGLLLTPLIPRFAR